MVKDEEVTAEWCAEHEFDIRCLKKFSKNLETGHLDVVLDADSEYYNERSAKCLFGSTGIDFIAETKGKTKNKEIVDALSKKNIGGHCATGICGKKKGEKEE